MAKYYLYTLLAIYIFLNGVSYFEKELEKSLKKRTLLMYKLEKQKLFMTHKKEVNNILDIQKSIFSKNSEYFFEKLTKETIVFSEIQSFIQKVSKSIDGRIVRLQSGVVRDLASYRKYPISLDMQVIPEDINRFFQELYKNKKYLHIKSLYLVPVPRERAVLIKVTLIGYQIK